MSGQISKLADASRVDQNRGLGTDPANLEFSRSAMQAMGAAVLKRAVDHIASLPDQPVLGDIDAAERCRQLMEPAPAHGTDLDSLLNLLFDDLVPRSFTAPAPGYLAYIPGGGVFPAALADFITDTTNRFTGIWMAAPALVQLEANVLDWLRDWMGFPETTRGLLTTGGSMANFNAIVCARERMLGTEIRQGVLYASDQVHHSVMKSARLAGVLQDRVRMIPVDDEFRMRVDALTSAVADDRRKGLTPFLVVSSAGTTNTGAVDPIDTIADFCARERLWHHIDGAYGAFFHMCDELRPLLRGLPRGDSLTLDPHKGMFLPYGTGALLVRDGQALQAVHAATAGYLPAISEEFYDPSQHSPELSRGFPGLRVWLAIKLFGADRYKAAVAEKRALAVLAAERIARIPGIVMVAPPQLSLFAFHLHWPGAPLEAQNEATHALMDRVTRRGKVMLTGCTAGGRFLGRVCVLSFRTRREQIETCIREVEEETKAIIGERTSSRAV
jgi:aromatic-L-amino-acid decarboxylase